MKCVYEGNNVNLNKLSPWVREPPTGIQGHTRNVFYSFEVYASKSVRTPELYLFKLFSDSKYAWLVNNKESAGKSAECTVRHLSAVPGLRWRILRKKIDIRETFYRYHSDKLFVNLAARVIQKKWRDWSSRRHKAASIIQREWLDMYYNPTRGYCQARLHNDWQKCVETHQSIFK